MVNIAEALQIAIQHHQAGRLFDAEQRYRQILAVDANHADAWHLLGVIAHQQKQFRVAIERIERAIALDATKHTYYCNLANAYLNVENFAAANNSCLQAIQLKPNSAVAHFQQGVGFTRQALHEDAIACYKRAIAIKPDYVEAYVNLGVALKSAGRPEESVSYFLTALQHQPQLAEAYFNLGGVYYSLHQIDAAIAACQRAIQLNPQDAESYNTLGAACKANGDFSNALRCYERALQIKPNYANARINFAYLQLLLGNYESGWLEHECRWETTGFLGLRPSLPYIAWQGESLEGKTLLIYGEQGIGDEILFASCIPELLPQVKRLIVACEPRLIPLFQRSFPTTIIISKAWLSDASKMESLPPIHFQTPMGSVPRFTRNKLSDFPNRTQYLFSELARKQFWRTRVTELGAPCVIGISWRGGKDPLLKKIRSTTLQQWQAIFSTPQVCFVNLQYSDTRAEVNEFRTQTGVAIHSFPEIDPLKNMDDFAALISALDLVISIDNSTVHLAGALGVPTWVALPFVPDWRWLLNREDIPWYPTMRLFRQRTCDDWTNVFDRIAAALKQKAGIR